MKRLCLITLLGVVLFVFAACQKEPEKDPVVVVKLGETGTPSPSPTEAPTDTPTPAATNTPTPSPSPTPAVTDAVTPVPVSDTPTPVPATDFLSLLNNYRKENGVAAIVTDETLTLLAGVRLAEVSVSGLSHTRPNGEEYESLLPVYHAEAAAVCEFVFSLSGVTEEKAFAAFSGSKEHAKEMLRDYTHVSFATDGTYVVVWLAKDFRVSSNVTEE